MSLIPSESVSFPDDFSRAITRARALNEAKATAELLNSRSKRARPVVVPAAQKPPPSPPVPIAPPAAAPVAIKPPPVKPAVKQKPAVEKTAGEQKPSVEIPAVELKPAVLQKPAVEETPAAKVLPLPKPAPAPIKIVPRARKAIETPATADVGEKVVPIKRQPRLLGELLAGVEAKKAEQQSPRVPIVRPALVRAAPALSIPAPQSQPAAEAIAIEPRPQKFTDESEDRPVLKFRGRRKWKNFIIAEGIALGVLIPTASLALTHYFADPVMVFVMNILTIAGAVVVGVSPILFFAIAPTLPRDGR